MKKGFVISWYYPPGNSSEGLVTFKLLKNSKYQYDVWTRDDQQQNVWDRKSHEDKLIANNVKIIPGKCENEREWVKEGVKYFVKHKDEYDFIMSRSMPVESHEIAMIIKEKYPGIRWIASFGDPIVNTPYIDEITMGGNDGNPFRLREYFLRENLSVPKALRVFISPTRQAKSYLWKREKKDGNKIAEYFSKINNYVLQNADALIYNNQYQLRHAFIEDHLLGYKKKSHILEHSFDSDLYPKEAAKNNKKLSFIYVGHLDDTRNARSLLKAIKKLKLKDKNLNKKVVFTFYGHLGNGDKLFILDNDLSDVVKVKKDIKYLESLKVTKNADWAILIDANFTGLVDDCIYLPAKLIDYIGAETNVFSISHVKGAGSDIIHEIGGGKVVTHSPDDIYLYLSKIIYQGFKPAPYNREKAKRLSSREMSKKLDRIIETLLKGSRR